MQHEITVIFIHLFLKYAHYYSPNFAKYSQLVH